MAKASPTAKALKELREGGWLAEKVEQRLPIPGKFVTRDLYQCIDLVCMKPCQPLLAVQVTSRSNVNARLMKSKVMAAVWVSTGNRFVVIGYGTTKTKGERRVVQLSTDGTWKEEHASYEL